MHLKNVILLSGIFTCVLSCIDTGPNLSIPDCIENALHHFSPICKSGGSVDEYLLNEEFVYVFNNGSCCCDIGNIVLDSLCDTLGVLDGFAGNTKINGIEFDQAQFSRTIWSK